MNAAGMILLLLPMVSASSEPTVTVVGRQPQQGVFRGIAGTQGRFFVRLSESQLPLEEVARVVFPSAQQKATSARTVIILNDGSELWGAITKGGGDTVTFDSPSAGTLTVSLEKVRAVLFPDSFRTQRDFHRARLAPPQQRSQDSARTVEATRINGIVTELRPDAVVIQTENLGTMTLPQKRVCVVELAQVEKQKVRAGLRLTAVLRDGSALRGTIGRLSSEGITLASSVGSVKVPYRELKELLVRGGRWVFLDELAPAERTERSFIGSLTWPFRLNANCLGDPLRLKGTMYRRGLGVHSYCKLSYALNAKYERFQSLVGLDDAAVHESLDVRFGNVVFAVYVDGEKKFDSGPVSWNDPVKEVDLTVRGATALQLEVSEGKGFHIRDRADWVEARLLKARGSVP